MLSLGGPSLHHPMGRNNLYSQFSHTLCLIKSIRLGLLFAFLAYFHATLSFSQINPTPLKVLAFFSASYDAAHINYAHEANQYFPKVAAKNNFTYDSTKDWNLLNDPTLATKYQVIMFLDNQPSASQRAGFQKYMDNGGGFIGFHVCAFTTNAADWDWYHNKLLGGGAFRSNTWGPTSAIMKVEDTTHPVTKGFPIKFKSEVSEWYNWTVDVRKNPDIKVLCSIDPSSYPLGTDPNQSWTSGDNPIVWTHKKYKMIYCNSGHNDMDYAKNTAKSLTFENAQHATLILNAINWLGGRNSTTDIHENKNMLGTTTPMKFQFHRDNIAFSYFSIKDAGVAILDLQGRHITASQFHRSEQPTLRILP
jgi:uncharacterized protein